MRHFAFSRVLGLSLLIIPSVSVAQTAEEVTRTVRAYDRLLDSMGTRIHVALSPDKQLRVWSWDTGLPDSLNDGLHIYFAFAEFKTGRGIQTKELELIDFDDDSERYTRGICYAIDTIPIYDVLPDKKSITYFLYFHNEGDSGYCNDDVQAYMIKGDELIPDDDAFSFSFNNGDNSNNVHLSYICSSTGKYPPFWMNSEKNVFSVAVLDTNDCITSTAARYSRSRGNFFHYGFIYHPEPGRSLSDFKKALIHSIDDIHRFNDSTDHHTIDLRYDDSLENANSWLGDYLKVTLPGLPETLSDSITPPSFLVRAWYGSNVHYDPMIKIASSADYSMRIWTWNTLTGGSMPAMEHIIEYQTTTGIRISRTDGADMIDTVFTVSSKTGKKYYLPRAAWRGDGRNSGRSINAYSIDGETLNTDAKIFEVPKDNDGYGRRKNENELQSCLSIGEQDCPIAEIKMNPKGNKLFIQHIEFNKENQAFLSSKWDLYQFNGEHFIYKGITK